MIETLQPAQVADMDHTTNSRSKFNEHTIVRDIFHETCMTTSFIQRNDLRFVLISEFKEFFCIDRGIRPCDLRYVHETFHTWLDLEECTIVFDVHHAALHDIAFSDILTEYIPWMWSELFQTK